MYAQVPDRDLQYQSLILSFLSLFCFEARCCEKMSSCGGNCGCGAECKCGNGCGGCKMYPDLTLETGTASETVVMGVTSQKQHFTEGSVMGAASENGCKCGDNCTCDPCNCK